MSLVLALLAAEALAQERVLLDLEEAPPGTADVLHAALEHSRIPPKQVPPPMRQLSPGLLIGDREAWARVRASSSDCGACAEVELRIRGFEELTTWRTCRATPRALGLRMAAEIEERVTGGPSVLHLPIVAIRADGAPFRLDADGHATELKSTPLALPADPTHAHAELMRLIPGSRPRDATASADGRYLAVVTTIGVNDDLLVADREAGSWARVTQWQGNNREPAWSPSASHLTFIGDRSGRAAIWVASRDGAVQRELPVQGDWSRPRFAEPPKVGHCPEQPSSER